MIDTAKALTLAGIEMQWRTVSFSNFVDAARNDLIREFMASDYTDLVFIDDDIGWEVGGFLRMLCLDADVMGAICPRKKDPLEWNVNLISADGKRIERYGMLECAYVGTGLMRIRRNVMERMERCFDTAYENGRKIGEDAWFCREWRRMGGQVWAYPDIDITHSGLKNWTGNYRRDCNAY
jgi:hypothetical protein